MRALGCCSRNSRWDLHQGMCPQFLSVQTSASQALGMRERLEPSRDLWRDAGKTFGKLLCCSQQYPTPAMGAAAHYFNGILGGDCAENLIPNAKPCSRVEAQSDGRELCVNLTSSRGFGFFFPGVWRFFFFFNFVPTVFFFPTIFIIIFVN